MGDSKAQVENGVEAGFRQQQKRVEREARLGGLGRRSLALKISGFWEDSGEPVWMLDRPPSLYPSPTAPRRDAPYPSSRLHLSTPAPLPPRSPQNPMICKLGLALRHPSSENTEQGGSMWKGLVSVIYRTTLW